MAVRMRVVLRWVQITDKMEPFYKDGGEFRFSSRVSSDGPGRTQETRFPSEGYYEISDHPAWNKLKLDKVIFDGDVNGELLIEVMGEEIDKFSANDQLEPYRREFVGSPASWIGSYGPGPDIPEGDSDPSDPENMSNWCINYVIERA